MTSKSNATRLSVMTPQAAQRIQSAAAKANDDSGSSSVFLVQVGLMKV